MRLTVELVSDLDIVQARRLGQSIAQEEGFSAINQARVAMMVSELARVFFVSSLTIPMLHIRSCIADDQQGIEIRVQGSGSELLTKLLEYTSPLAAPPLPGNTHRITRRKQYWNNQSQGVLEQTQEGALILIEHVWQPKNTKDS